MTLKASLSCQVKQTRHWLLILMLCCPFLLPFNNSSRLEGGTTLKSFKILARLSIRSFPKATRCISFGNFLEKFLLKIFSISLH